MNSMGRSKERGDTPQRELNIMAHRKLNMRGCLYLEVDTLPATDIQACAMDT